MLVSELTWIKFTLKHGDSTLAWASEPGNMFSWRKELIFGLKKRENRWKSLKVLRKSTIMLLDDMMVKLPTENSILKSEPCGMNGDSTLKKRFTTTSKRLNSKPGSSEGMDLNCCAWSRKKSIKRLNSRIELMPSNKNGKIWELKPFLSTLMKTNSEKDQSIDSSSTNLHPSWFTRPKKTSSQG